MLTFWGRQREFCDGVSRRDFLRVGALGAGTLGLTLADLLRLQAAAPSPVPSTVAGVKPGDRCTLRRGAGQKAVIMVYLPGGPSHIDMYDPKPEAPAEYRGEFKAIDTNVPGIQICELMPRQARLMDKLAVIRSVVGSDGDHSAYQFVTGYTRNAHRPALGSVVSRIGADASGDMPPYVSLNRMGEEDPRYLGAAHRPFTPSGPGLENLSLASGVDMSRLQTRKSLLSTFDTLRREIDASGTMEGIDEFTQRAFEMISSGAVRQAFDLSKEDPRTVDTYGKEGRSFLQARRLIEAGVRVVTLSIGGWDTHGDNFKTLRKQLPQVDNALASLVEDLHARGLSDDVAVVMWGEFGRTPKINGGAGRDHWPQVMSVLMAGGGLRTGQVVGATDGRAERAVDRPVTTENVHATIYHALGIDPAQSFVNEAGRPVYVLDNREVIRELV
jgi:hypothetical protein